MPSQHKHSPIAFRPPEGDRAWLLQYAEQSGQPVNRVLAEALAALRASKDQPAVHIQPKTGRECPYEAAGGACNKCGWAG